MIDVNAAIDKALEIIVRRTEKLLKAMGLPYGDVEQTRREMREHFDSIRADPEAMGAFVELMRQHGYSDRVIEASLGKEVGLAMRRERK